MKGFERPWNHAMAAPPNQDANELTLSRFDFKNFKTDRIALLVGKRGTGKTILLENLLAYLCKHYDGGIGVSPTISTQETFARFMPNSCIYTVYNEDTIMNLVTELRKFTANKVRKRVFIILDDCMFDPSFLKTTSMRDIHFNGRTLVFSLVFSLFFFFVFRVALLVFTFVVLSCSLVVFFVVFFVFSMALLFSLSFRCLFFAIFFVVFFVLFTAPSGVLFASMIYARSLERIRAYVHVEPNQANAHPPLLSVSVRCGGGGGVCDGDG